MTWKSLATAVMLLLGKEVLGEFLAGRYSGYGDLRMSGINQHCTNGWNEQTIVRHVFFACPALSER